MVIVGIALMTVMMGGMLLMHLGGRGHSGHGAKEAAPVAASTSAVSGGAPHVHLGGENGLP